MENEQSEARKLKYSVSTPLGSQEHSSATDEGPMGPTGVHAHWGHGSGAEAGTWGASQGRPFCFAETAGKAEDPVTPGDSAIGMGWGGQSSHCVTQSPMGEAGLC